MMAQKVYYESQQVPLLPRYTLATLYGIQHKNEIDNPVERLSSANASNGRRNGSSRRTSRAIPFNSNSAVRATPRFPIRSSGSVVLPDHPISTSTRRQLHIVAGQNVAEEYPFKLVTIPWSSKETAAGLKAFSLDTVSTTRPHTFQSAIANRHLPKGLGVFYMEVDVDTQGSLIIGIVQFKTMFGVEGETISDEINGGDINEQNLSNNSIENQNGQDDQNNAEDLNYDPEEVDGNDDNDSIHDRSGRYPILGGLPVYVEDDEYESYSAQETDEDSGTMSGDEQTINPHASYLGHFSIRSDDRKPRIFRKCTVCYDRRPDDGVDNLTLEPGLQRTSAPIWHWDVKGGFFVDGKSNVAIKRDEPIKRAGLIVDRVQKKLICVADGCELSPPIDFNFDSSQGELFPFVLICDAKCRVQFGNGRLPNDGFKFGINTYISKIWDSTLMQTADIPTDPYDYMSLVSTNEYKIQMNQRCTELINEYMEFYGYCSGPSFNKDLRLAVFDWDFLKIRSLLRDYNLSHVEFDLLFYEFVITCLDPARSAEALELGRQLLQQTTPPRAEEIKIASTIIVTQEPRPAHLARFYGDEAKTKLLRKLLLIVNKPTKLQQLAQTQFGQSKLYGSDERKASALAKINEICGTMDTWEW